MEKEAIGCRMTETIVDDFEPLQVQIEDRKQLSGIATIAKNHPIHAIEK
jgi:hypothetical protein